MSNENLCRLCGLKLPLSHLKNLQELKNEQLDLLIVQYLQIKIAESDGLPSTACKLCCKTLYDFDQYFGKVKVVQQKFRSTISVFTSSGIKLENESNLYLMNCNEIEQNNVKTEVYYGNDYDNFDHFISGFGNESDDNSDTGAENSNAIDDNKSGNFGKDSKDIEKNEILSTIKADSKIVLHNDKKRKRIQYKCYKCDYMVRTAECLQDHFKLIHNAKPEYVCVVCNALFDSLLEFESHEHSGKKRKVYPCEFCGKQFYNSTNIKAHRNLHLGIKPFECEICGKKFRLKRHKEVHKITVCSKQINDLSNDVKTDEENEIKPNDLYEKSDTETKTTNDVQPEFKSKWKCEKCDEYFHNEHILQKHIKNVHEIKNLEYNCSDCFETFDNNDEYEKHLKSAHGISNRKSGSAFKCDKCSKQFNHSANYRAHLLIHSGVKKFSCDKCGKKFTLKNHLVAHSLTHLKSSTENGVKCNQCDKICKNHVALQFHLKAHIPPEEKYKSKCDICDKKFVSLENYEKHQYLVHEKEKEKESICDQCGKVFKNKHQLASHLNSHIDMTLKCDECPKIFKSAAGLKRHKFVHTGEKRYECEVCGKKFSLRAQLTVHASIHIEELPYECSYCKKRFRQKYYLKTHLRQHTGERPYSCTECNHFFANDSNFIKHLKGKHGLRNFSIQNQHRYPFVTN